jgi:hypothetical protein
MTAGCIFSLCDQQQPRGLADEWSTEPPPPPAPNICNNQNQLCNEQHNAVDGCLEFYSFAQRASARAKRWVAAKPVCAARTRRKNLADIVFSSSSFDTARALK